MAYNEHLDRYVVGLFDDRHEADQVVRELKDGRFDSGHIDTVNHGTAGHVVNKLKDHGVPDKHAHYYAEGVRRGGHLVTVATDNAKGDTAADIMHRHGAVDINRRAAFYQQEGFDRYDEGANAYSDREIADDRKRYAEKEATLPEIEENVSVGKERTQTGGVRVFQREREVPVERDVTLREEHVHVDRRNADRPATAADMNSPRGEVAVRETSERPVVSKEARVTGEVHVGKTAEQRTEHVHETAKKRDVDVERTDGGATSRRP